MDYICQIEDKCSYVGVYCVSLCESFFIPIGWVTSVIITFLISNSNIIGCVVYVRIEKKIINM